MVKGAQIPGDSSVGRLNFVRVSVWNFLHVINLAPGIFEVTRRFLEDFEFPPAMAYTQTHILSLYSTSHLSFCRCVVIRITISYEWDNKGAATKGNEMYGCFRQYYNLDF